MPREKFCNNRKHQLLGFKKMLLVDEDIYAVVYKEWYLMKLPKYTRSGALEVIY